MSRHRILRFLLKRATPVHDRDEINRLIGIIETMALDLTKANDANTKAIAAIETLLGRETAKDAQIADLTAQLAAATTNPADQTAVDTNAQALLDEVAKVPA